jgi:hypothetical protein
MAEVIAEEFGVRLTFEGSPLKSGKGGAHYRLTTLRPNPPRMFANKEEVLAAFEREVAASKLDPVVVEIVRRGL